MGITGVESQGSAPILWKTPQTGNDTDPGPWDGVLQLCELFLVQWLCRFFGVKVGGWRGFEGEDKMLPK